MSLQKSTLTALLILIPILLNPPQALAVGMGVTGTSVQVHLRIEDLAGTIWKGWVEIPQSVTIYCYNSGKTYTIQGDNVLAVLDKASKSAGFSYTVSDQWYPDFYVDSIAGHKAEGEYGWMYRVNYSLPEISINGFMINASDDILIYWGTMGVRPLKVEVDQSEVDTGESFLANVTYRNDSSGNWIPLAEATLKVNDSLNDNYTTDAEGNVHLTLNETGAYSIYAEKWGDAPQNQFVRSDVVQVSVGAPSTITTTYTTTTSSANEVTSSATTTSSAYEVTSSATTTSSAYEVTNSTTTSSSIPEFPSSLLLAAVFMIVIVIMDLRSRLTTAQRKKRLLDSIHETSESHSE